MRLLRVHDLRVDPPAVVDSQLAAAFKSAVMFETLHRRKDGSAFRCRWRLRRPASATARR
jgi:hypothetical protein